MFDEPTDTGADTVWTVINFVLRNSVASSLKWQPQTFIHSQVSKQGLNGPFCTVEQLQLFIVLRTIKVATLFLHDHTIPLKVI